MLFPMVIQLSLVIAWTTFLVFWFTLAFRVNKTIKRESSGSRASYTIAAMAAYVLLFTGVASWGLLGERFLPDTRLWPVIGIILTYAGIFLAIWARAILGKNWSSAVTIKQDHRLIRTGPYSMMRHPIYSGILLAIVGTAVVKGEVKGLLAVPALLIAFLIKFRKEEHFMVEQFGREYEEYRQHTKALIPFIF